MKIIRILIGIMLVLALCITPVAAVSADDFEIVSWREEGNFNYKYCNLNDPYDKYIHLQTDYSQWCYSCVTFKPANIPDAPVMVVNTSYYDRDIYLSQSVDDWEIKYYSNYWSHLREPDSKYLKNAGVVNLNEVFKNQIKNRERLYLELSWYQRIHPVKSFYPCCNIPEA